MEGTFPSTRPVSRSNQGPVELRLDRESETGMLVTIDQQDRPTCCAHVDVRKRDKLEPLPRDDAVPRIPSIGVSRQCSLDNPRMVSLIGSGSAYATLTVPSRALPVLEQRVPGVKPQVLVLASGHEGLRQSFLPAPLLETGHSVRGRFDIARLESPSSCGGVPTGGRELLSADRLAFAQSVREEGPGSQQCVAQQVDHLFRCPTRFAGGPDVEPLTSQ